MDKLLLLAVMFGLLAPSALFAQHRAPDDRDVPGVSSRLFASAALAYPEVLAGGVTIVLGKRRLGEIPGRGSTLRGIAAGAEIGVGGVSARVGWTALFEYDAGIDGWSVDAVYVRPWLMEWGPRRGADYLGAGVTRYLGFVRFSGAVVVNDWPGQRHVSSTFKFGIMLPP